MIGLFYVTCYRTSGYSAEAVYDPTADGCRRAWRACRLLRREGWLACVYIRANGHDVPYPEEEAP